VTARHLVYSSFHFKNDMVLCQNNIDSQLTRFHDGHADGQPRPPFPCLLIHLGRCPKATRRVAQAAIRVGVLMDNCQKHGQGFPRRSRSLPYTAERYTASQLRGQKWLLFHVSEVVDYHCSHLDYSDPAPFRVRPYRRRAEASVAFFYVKMITNTNAT
jgi:hypothetical protein